MKSMKFDYSLGIPSRNRIVNENGRLKNSYDVGWCSIWLGEGDFCLCIDLKTSSVVGASGDFGSADIVPRDIRPVFACDGNVFASVGFALFECTFLCYRQRGICFDGARGILEFGNRELAEIYVKVACNLTIGLNGGDICCAIIDGISCGD